MQLILMAAFALIVFFALTIQTAGSANDRPQEAKDALIQVNKFRTFMYVASEYMRTVTVAPAVTTTIPWSTMAASPIAPPGMAATSMPAGWRVVQATDKSWVACTEMEERAVSAVGQLVAATSRVDGSGTLTISPAPAAMVPVTIASQSYVVIGTTTTALGRATLCN